MLTTPCRSAASTASAAGGLVLAGATRTLAAVRPAGKPLHPRGRLVTAVLRRHGVEPRTGVPWLDDSGVDEVLVRWSTAVGLPPGLPDVQGLAVRVPLAEGDQRTRHADLLFASTGKGRLTRFVLTVARSAYGRPLTTLMPYRSPRGPLVLAALPRSAGRFELACASPGGEWRPFAELTLSETQGPDPTISFDPVRNTVPGLQNYEAVRLLREPSYLVARRSRSEGGGA